MVALNVLGLLYVSHAALPHLLRAAEEEPRRVADLVNISSVAGRRVGAGGGVYQLTKHGVGAFSEALRQEVTGRHVRVSLVEPGATATELASHNRPEVQEHGGGFAGDPRVPVGGAGGDALEQRQHPAHLGHRIQRADEMHLRRARVHEAHVDTRAGQAGDESLGADHEVPPDVTARS